LKIKFFLAFLPFLFFACQKETVSKTTIQEMNNILDQSIRSSKDNYEYMDRNIYDALREPQRKKFRFLGDAIKKQQDEYSIFLKELDRYLPKIKASKFDFEKKKETLNHYKNLLDKLDSSMMFLYQTEITKNHKIVGLRKSNVEERVKDSKNNLRLLSNSIDPKVSNDISIDAIFHLKLKMFQYCVAERISFFGQLYSELIGGNPSCGFTNPFPIIYPKKSQIKEGEYFEAEVFIGSHFYDYYEETFGAIIINETDTINIDKKTGKALLKIKANKKGEFNLNIGARVSNELTGEIIGGNMIYNYHVD
jgi:hypothetical protein